jgi:hypothetical protein
MLFWAVKEYRIDVVKWLLDEGANPNGIDPESVPLDLAIRMNCRDIVFVLDLKQAYRGGMEDGERA